MVSLCVPGFALIIPARPALHFLTSVAPAAPINAAPPPSPSPAWRRLFEAVTPLLPDLVGRLSADIAPFCSVPAGMRFTAGGGAGGADEAGGAWRNFFVGLVGNVAAHEDDILWPNQVGAGGLTGWLVGMRWAGCQVERPAAGAPLTTPQPCTACRPQLPCPALH